MQKRCTDPVEIADSIATFETSIKNAREEVTWFKT
jgi:hypothetical protein